MKTVQIPSSQIFPSESRIEPKTADLGGRSSRFFPDLGTNICAAILTASLPEMRMVAIPPFPRGVDTADMVVWSGFMVLLSFFIFSMVWGEFAYSGFVLVKSLV